MQQPLVILVDSKVGVVLVPDLVHHHLNNLSPERQLP